MLPLRHRIKDPFPALSHWFGVAFAAAATVTLIILSAGRPWHVVAFSLYGTTLVLLFLASALAHTIHCSQATSDRLTRLDYMAIFLLIAGTYTPFCLIALRETWGWWMLSAEWSMAAAGIIAVAFGRARSNLPRTILYIFMAWVVALVAIGPMSHALPRAALSWLLAGGAVYTAGAAVFAVDRPHLWPGRFVAHDLWHLMVLVGSGCHFIAMLLIAR